MRIGIIASMLLVSACAQTEFEVPARLQSVATPLLEHAAQEDRINMAVKVNQPEPYAAFVDRAFLENQFRFVGNAERLKLSKFGAQQILLPQFRPNASVGLNGSVLVRIGVSQTLYDGGLSAAETFSSQSDAIVRQISLLNDLNDSIQEDIGYYLDYHQNMSIAHDLRSIIAQLDDMQAVAEARRTGGVGTSSEVSLFQLKVLEMETELQIAEAAADLALARLSDIDMVTVKTPPTDFDFDAPGVPIEVMQALALREQRRSDIEIQRSNARPQVSVEGQVGYDVRTGLPTTNVSLETNTNSDIAFGGNTDLQLALNELQMAELELQDTVRVTELRISQIIAEMETLSVQVEQAKFIASQSGARLHGFHERFMAGEAGLTEAASAIDTVRRSMESQTLAKFRIFRSQLELAHLSGSLLPEIE